MDLIAFLLFPILLIVAFVRVVSPENKGRRFRIAAVTLGIPFLIFFVDEIIGQSYLNLQCAVDGGLNSSKELSAEGYFSADDHSGCGSECLHALLRRGLKYYEVDVQGSYAFYTTKRGMHRFYLADKHSGECADGRPNDLPHPRHLEKDFMPQGKCVAYRVLEGPDSRYEVSMNNKSPVWPFRKGQSRVWPYPARLYKEFSYVKDRKSGEVVASYTSFWWWGGWLRNNSFGHNSATVCPAIGSVNADVRDLIIANKN